ncbi:MAG: hypothetical protein WEA79_11135 [Balneolaceae bacterium]
MSTEIPTIHIEPVDPERKLTFSDLVELGEQIYSEIQQSKTGTGIEVPEPTPAPAPAKNKNIAALTSSGIVLVAGVMLAKKIFF